jgi:hypothetical protein
MSGVTDFRELGIYLKHMAKKGLSNSACRLSGITGKLNRFTGQRMSYSRKMPAACITPITSESQFTEEVSIVDPQEFSEIEYIRRREEIRAPQHETEYEGVLYECGFSHGSDSDV